MVCNNPFSGLSSGTLKKRPCGLPAGLSIVLVIVPCCSSCGKRLLFNIQSLSDCLVFNRILCEISLLHTPHNSPLAVSYLLIYRFHFITIRERGNSEFSEHFRLYGHKAQAVKKVYTWDSSSVNSTLKIKWPSEKEYPGMGSTATGHFGTKCPEVRGACQRRNTPQEWGLTPIQNRTAIWYKPQFFGILQWYISELSKKCRLRETVLCKDKF